MEKSYIDVPETSKADMPSMVNIYHKLFEYVDEMYH